MNSRGHKLLVFVISVWSITCLMASAQQRLDLASCLETALRQNSDILKAREDLQRVEGVIVQAKANVYPQLSLNTELDSTRNQLQPFPLTHTYWTSGVQLEQQIYSGGALSSAIDIAKLTNDAAYQRLNAVSDNIVFKTRMVYYHALYSKSVVKVQEEAIHLLEEELATQKKRLAAGTTTRFGVLRAEVELANAQPDLIKARNDQQTAYIELAKLLAIPYPPNQQDAPFDLDGELEYKPQTFQVQDIITAALKNRPELRVAEKNIEIEKKQVDISRSNYYPHVSGYTGYQLNSDRTKSSLTEMVNGWVAGIQGSWKIFDSDMTKGKIEQNQADLHKAVIDLDETRRDIDAEAREAYLSLQQAEQLIDAQQKTTEQAKEALRLADERYGVGMATQLDVLNARIALTRARTNELEARYNYNIAIADLEKIMAVPLNEISKT